MPLVNCTAYRMLVSPHGAQMQQGDVVLIWGAAGGLGGFARAVRAQRRRLPGLRRLVARRRRRSAARPARSGSSTARPRATASGARTGAQDEKESLRLGKAIRELTGGRDPRRRLRAPRPRHLRRERVRDAARRQDRHLRLDDRLHARVRQPLPVDVHEDDHRLAPRELRARAGRPTSSCRRAARTRSSAAPTRWPRPGRPPTTCTRNAHLGKVGVLCIAPSRRARACWTASCASGTWRGITRYRSA